MSTIQQVIPEITVVMESGTVNSMTKQPGLATLRKNMPSVLNVPNCSLTLSGFGNLPNGIEITTRNNRFTISALPRVLMTPSIQIPQFEPEEDLTLTQHINASTVKWGAVIDPSAIQLPAVVTPIPTHQYGLAAQAPWGGGPTITGDQGAAVASNPIFGYTVSNIYGLVGINTIGHNYTNSVLQTSISAYSFNSLNQFGNALELAVQNSLGQKLWFPASDTLNVPASWAWGDGTPTGLNPNLSTFKDLQIFSSDNWAASNSGTNNYITYTPGYFYAADPALGLDWNITTYGYGCQSKVILNSMYYSCPDMGQNPYAMGGPIQDFNRYNAVTTLNRPNTFRLPTGSHNSFWSPIASQTYQESDKVSFYPFWNNRGVPIQNYVESNRALGMQPSAFMATLTQNLCKVQPNYNVPTYNADQSNNDNNNTSSVFCYENFSAPRNASQTGFMKMCVIPTKLGCKYTSPADECLDKYLYNSGFRADLGALCGHFWSGGRPDIDSHIQDLGSRYCPMYYQAVSPDTTIGNALLGYKGSGQFNTAFCYGTMTGSLGNTPAAYESDNATLQNAAWNINPWGVILFNNPLGYGQGINTSGILEFANEDILWTGSPACNLPRILYNMNPPNTGTNTAGTPQCDYANGPVILDNTTFGDLMGAANPKAVADDAAGVACQWILPPCFGCFNLPDEPLGLFNYNPYCSNWFSTVGGRPGETNFVEIHYNNAPTINELPNPMSFTYGSNYWVNYIGSLANPSQHFKTNGDQPFRPDAPYDAIHADAPFTLDHQNSYPRTMGYLMPRSKVLLSTAAKPYIHPINNSRDSVMNGSLTAPFEPYVPVIGHTYPPFINKRGNGLFVPGWPSPPHVVTLSAPRPLSGTDRHLYACANLTSDDPGMICPKADLTMGASMTYGTCDFPINQTPLPGLLPMFFNALPHSTILSKPDQYQSPPTAGTPSNYSNVYNHHVLSSSGIMPMPCGHAQDIRYVCNMRMASIMKRNQTNAHDYSEPLIWKHTFTLPVGTYSLPELEITLNQLLNNTDDNGNYPFFRKIDFSEAILTSCDYEDDVLSWRGKDNTATYPIEGDTRLAKGNRYGPPTTDDQGIGVVVSQGPNTKNKFFGAPNLAFVVNQQGAFEIQQTTNPYNLSGVVQSATSKLNTALSSIFWTVNPGSFDPYFTPLWGELGQGDSVIDPFMVAFSAGLEPMDLLQATSYQPPGTTPVGTTGNVSIGASYQALIGAYNSGFFSFDPNSVADAGSQVIYGTGSPASSLFQTEINYNASQHLFLGQQTGFPNRTQANPYGLATSYTSLGPGTLTDGYTPSTQVNSAYAWNTSPAAIAINNRRINYYEQAIENIQSGRVFNICGGTVSFLPGESDIQIMSLADVTDDVEVAFWSSLGFDASQLTLFTPAIAHIKPVEGLVYSANEGLYVGSSDAFCFSKENPDLQFQIPDIYIRTIPDTDITVTTSAGITEWLGREFPTKYKAQLLLNDPVDYNGNQIGSVADGNIQCAHPMMLFAPTHMNTIANRKFGDTERTLLQDLCSSSSSTSQGFFDWYVYPQVNTTHQSFSVCIFGALAYLPILGGQLYAMANKANANIDSQHNFAMNYFTAMSVVEMLTINPYLYQGTLPFDLNYHYSGNIFAWKPTAAFYQGTGSVYQSFFENFYESSYQDIHQALTQVDVATATPQYPPSAPNLNYTQTRYDYPHPRQRLIANASTIYSCSQFDYDHTTFPALGDGTGQLGWTTVGFYDDCKLIKGSNMQWPTQGPWMLDPWEFQLPLQGPTPGVFGQDDTTCAFPQRHSARDAACLVGPCPPRWGFTNMLCGSGLGDVTPPAPSLTTFNNGCLGFYQNMNFIIQHYMQTRVVSTTYTFNTTTTFEVARTGYALQAYHDNWVGTLPDRITGTNLTALQNLTTARFAEYIYSQPAGYLNYFATNAVDYVNNLQSEVNNNDDWDPTITNGWIAGLGQTLVYKNAADTVSQDFILNSQSPAAQVPQAGRIVLDEIAVCAINQKPMTGYKGLNSNPSFAQMQSVATYEQEKLMESRTCKTFGIVTNYSISKNKVYLGPSYDNTSLQGMPANTERRLVNTVYTSDSVGIDQNQPQQITDFTTNFLAGLNFPKVITPIFTSGMIVSVSGPSFLTSATTIYGDQIYNNAVLLSVSNNFANMNSVTFSSALVCTLANQNIPFIEVNLINPSTGTPVADFSYLHLVLTFTPTNAPTAQQISFAQGLSVSDVLGQTGMASDQSNIVGSPAISTPVNTNIKRVKLTPTTPTSSSGNPLSTLPTRQVGPRPSTSTSNNTTSS